MLEWFVPKPYADRARDGLPLDDNKIEYRPAMLPNSCAVTSMIRTPHSYFFLMFNNRREGGYCCGLFSLAFLFVVQWNQPWESSIQTT